MKMVPYDREKLMFQRHYKRTKNLRILEDFVNSNSDCVRLEDYGHSSAKSCRESLIHSMVNFDIKGVKVITRGEDVFLVKVKL